jgi:MoxR-like ATPase
MLKNRIESLLNALHNGLYEREEALRLAFLSAIAGESTFMIGPPGVAKSLIARRLKHVFQDAKAFEYLMNRFSTPDEIFGPVSIQELKNDKYHRQTEHYLPGAEVVFLDEIWKAGPSIQNTLLTVLNEKIYRNGAQEEKIPMIALIAASNELPATGQGLEALWDRFLVRLQVDGIEEEDAFNAMITHSGDLMDDPVEASNKIKKKELIDWRKKVQSIKIPPEVLKVIQLFRAAVQKYNEKYTDSEIYISDRRWKKVIKLLRTSAYLNDRTAADLVDLFLVPHCTWEEPGQFETLDKFMTELVKKHGYSMGLELSGVSRAIKDLESDVNDEIYVTTQKKLEGYLVNKKGMILVKGLENHFEGKYVSLDEVENLDAQGHWEVIQIYDGNGVHKDNAQAKNLQKNGTIEICEYHYQRNAKSYSLPLLSGTEFQRLHKKPHEAVVKTWEAKAENIRKKIVQKRTSVEKYRDKDLAKSKDNLFTEEGKFDLVTSNVASTLKRIKDLEVDLDKEIHRFQNVEDGKVDFWEEPK